jgi:hypothetical protein
MQEAAANDGSTSLVILAVMVRLLWQCTTRQHGLAGQAAAAHPLAVLHKLPADMHASSTAAHHKKGVPYIGALRSIAAETTAVLIRPDLHWWAHLSHAWPSYS